MKQGFAFPTSDGKSMSCPRLNKALLRQGKKKSFLNRIRG
jgi:hypothetical protein